MERTFVMIKPDGVQRGLVGKIVSALEAKGYKMVGVKLLRLSREKAALHYAEHQGKSFYESLLEYITSGPVVAMVWEGKAAIKGIRTLMGSTNPLEAAPGSIRGRYGHDMTFNLIHGSDSPESARREIELYFQNDELLEYQRSLDQWIYK